MAVFAVAPLAGRVATPRPEDSARLRAAVAPLRRSLVAVPDLCGVYVLILNGEVVYVGASSKAGCRFNAHRRGERYCDRWQQPPFDFDEILFLPLPEALLGAYEGALIRALLPARNRKSPPLVSIEQDNEILEGLGLPPHSAEHAALITETGGRIVRMHAALGIGDSP